MRDARYERHEKHLTPELQELESTLGRLRPAGAAIDSGELMFRAGQRSVRRRNLLWPTLACVLACLLAVSLIVRPPARTVETIVYVPASVPAQQETLAEPDAPPDSPPPLPPVGDSSYLRLRLAALTDGADINWDALRGNADASSDKPAASAMTERQMLREMAISD